MSYARTLLLLTVPFASACESMRVEESVQGWGRTVCDLQPFVEVERCRLLLGVRDPEEEQHNMLHRVLRGPEGAQPSVQETIDSLLASDELHTLKEDTVQALRDFDGTASLESLAEFIETHDPELAALATKVLSKTKSEGERIIHSMDGSTSAP
jgi:hypothetical protein